MIVCADTKGEGVSAGPKMATLVISQQEKGGRRGDLFVLEGGDMRSVSVDNCWVWMLEEVDRKSEIGTRKYDRLSAGGH